MSGGSSEKETDFSKETDLSEITNVKSFKKCPISYNQKETFSMKKWKQISSFWRQIIFKRKKNKRYETWKKNNSKVEKMKRAIQLKTKY